jgi:hypothetical protein
LTKLREALRAFEQAQGPISLDDLSRQLDVDHGTLEAMLDFWVRKDCLRGVNSSQLPDGCTTCSAVSGCPFVANRGSASLRNLCNESMVTLLRDKYLSILKQCRYNRTK